MAYCCRDELQLHVVGSGSMEWALHSGALQFVTEQQQAVVFHGWLSDAELQLMYSSVRVAVAPLLTGAGVKGKVRRRSVPGCARLAACHTCVWLVLSGRCASYCMLTAAMQHGLASAVVLIAPSVITRLHAPLKLLHTVCACRSTRPWR
jgi:hypothetical protein